MCILMALLGYGGLTMLGVRLFTICYILASSRIIAGRNSSWWTDG